MLTTFDSTSHFKNATSSEVSRIVNQYRLSTVSELQILVANDLKVIFVWQKKDNKVSCELFYNDTEIYNSTLIAEATILAIDKWGDLEMMVTIDPKKNASQTGYGFQAAGWKFVGVNTSGLKVYKTQSQ